MKAIISIALLFFLINFPLISQDYWFWLNPLPQGNDLNDVFIINDQTAIAVGDQGTLLKTNNGGMTWNIQYYLKGFSLNLVEIDFVDSQKGWILANDFFYLNNNSSILLGTNDQGNSWNILLNLDSLRLSDIFFLNADTGWATGSGTILKTANGGVSWQPMIAPGTGGISSIFFKDQNEGWSAFDDSIYHSIDGGQTWSWIYTYPYQSVGACVKLIFLNNQEGWCVFQDISPAGIYYVIGNTTDGGYTWTWPLHGRDVYFLNPDTGWVAANSRIYSTKDGGTNWYCWDGHPFPPLEKTKSLHFNNFFNGLAVGPYGSILKSNDGGVSWNPVSSIETIYDLKDIYFIDSDTGWVAGEFSIFTIDRQYYGTVQKTEDGGITWSESIVLGPHFSTSGLTSIQFVNPNVGYITSGFGFFKSFHGGLDWIRMKEGYFSKTLFLSPDTGFLAERKWPAKLYKTTNGGNHWNQVSYQTGPIEDVYFINDFEGWSVGWHIPILHTTDGGNNWISISDSGWALNSVCFITPEIGWVAGGTQNYNPQFPGIIAKSIDGGNHWNILYTDWNYKFNSVVFLDTLNGIAVGEEISASSRTNDKTGIILYTLDGGITWNNYDSIVMKGLKNIFFTGNKSGWIIGAGGNIFKTDTGGGIVGFKQEQKAANDTPTSFRLKQNYPNPFNPNTTIEFSIPKTEFVTLKIYNLLGQEVVTLVSDKLSPGDYKNTWDAFDFASGIYYYKIHAGQFVKFRKLILMK